MVYDAMLEKMKQAADQDKNVVLDATFHKDDTRELFVRAMKDKCEIYFIEITAKEELIRQRLQKERPDSEADFEVYKLIRGEWDPMNARHLTLQSTDENIDYLLQKAADYLHWKNDKRTDQ